MRPFHVLGRLLCLLFVPRLVLEVAAHAAAGPSKRVVGSEIPRGFRDLRLVSGTVKDHYFVSPWRCPLGWIKVN